MTSDLSSTEGYVDFNIPDAGKECKTWYKIFQTPDTVNTVPLICLHGGPGIPHNYMLPIRHLSFNPPRPIIFYDQLGCGNSTHLSEKGGDDTFWTVSLFLNELENLLTGLGIREYDLLGQSWGGMLAAEHAALRPNGLRKLIIADSPASMKLWSEAANLLLEKLPEDVQKTLLKHEKDGTTDSEEYEQAMQVFYDRHVCRTKPTPREFEESMAALKGDSTVYMTMNGPSEFHVIGSLKTWSIIPSIAQINVPTLLINGKYDEAQDSVMQPFWEGIEKVKWVRFAESSHLPQLEETDEFLSIVKQFLE